MAFQIFELCFTAQKGAPRPFLLSHILYIFESKKSIEILYIFMVKIHNFDRTIICFLIHRILFTVAGLSVPVRTRFLLWEGRLVFSLLPMPILPAPIMTDACSMVDSLRKNMSRHLALLTGLYPYACNNPCYAACAADSTPDNSTTLVTPSGHRQEPPAKQRRSMVC